MELLNVPASPPLEDVTTPVATVEVETWRQFEQSATDHVPCLVEGIWPIGALGFIAAPPKKGKTWIGLALAISVATGRPYLGRFGVVEPRPVIYLALEGHRAAIRARVGALARGLNVNPDSGNLENLHFIYKPRGINLADPEWVAAVMQAVEQTNAALIIVDVLRAAALIKENSNEEFNALRLALMPLTVDGVAIALLHHFGKLTEITSLRAPGERMSGTGAMYGAMDVGIFITGSDEGARQIRVEFETRDLATPNTLGLTLEGKGTGDNHGFTYQDAAAWTVTDAPDEADLKAPAHEIRQLIADNGGAMTSSEIRAAYESDDNPIGENLLPRRRRSLEQLGVIIEHPRGRPTVYRIPAELTPAATPDTPTPAIAEVWGMAEVDPLYQAKNGHTPDTSATNPLADVKKRDLQGFNTPDTPAPLRGEPTAQAQAPPDDQRDEFFATIEPDPDDLPF